MTNKNLLLQQNPFAPAAPDTLEHLPSVHCVPIDQLWCIRCIGPDDLFAAKSKEEADATSAAHNRLIDKNFASNPMRESLRTVAEQWPYSAEAHAVNLIDTEDQP